MAKLNSESSARSFAAAVTAMSLGTGKRLMRNFRYYAHTSPAGATRSECLGVYSELRSNVFALQNLYLDDVNDGNSTFKVMLAKQIQDNLEELHRTILFYEVDDILAIISILDRLRVFWKQSTDASFYDEELPSRINRHVCSEFHELRRLITELPEQSNA